MNKKQLIVLSIGIGMIAVMGLFPPWHSFVPPTATPEPLGYAFIFAPPKDYGGFHPVLNIWRLMVQWAVVVFITGVLIFKFKNKKPKRPAKTISTHRTARQHREIWIMNKKQLIVLWIGIGIITLMGLFPPFQWHLRDGRTGITYAFIFSEDDIIALGNLVVQWAVVAFITGGLIITFAEKKPKDY